MNEAYPEVMNDTALLARITGFINEIGIPCKPGSLSDDTFLPGLDIKNGGIIYDLDLLKYPGDLLHEAGHVAVLAAADREKANSPDMLNGDLDTGAAEMAAICWSWAALQHLALEPTVVFHEFGYKNGSKNLVDNFNAERYIGLPLLQWLGMTNTSGEGEQYPKMTHWLRPGQ